MSEVQKIGLRDRKRTETRTRLEAAAVTLVLRDGLEHTTVDAISEMADVSPRTFFNYFDSKDSAILGLRHLEIDDHPVTEPSAQDGGADAVEAVVHLLFSVMGAPLVRPTIRQDRMEIVRRYPQILAGQFAQVTQMTSQMSEAVQVLLARDPRFSKQKPADLVAPSELILSMCSCAVRVAVKQWAEAGKMPMTKNLNNEQFRSSEM